MSSPSERLHELEKAKPKSRFVRGSAYAVALACGLALFSLEWSIGRIFAPATEPGLRRFLERDAKPFPLRDEGSSLSEIGPWLARIMGEYGWRALLATLLLALCASALAMAFALVIAPLVSRTLTQRDPYGSREARKTPLISTVMRNVCLAMRALPEYLLGFLLLSLLTGSVWPAVLALAIHNGGILGRLFGDTLEDVPTRPMRALAGGGSSRAGILLFGGVPLAFSRWLSFFFYRFETCVREATVLGMLGVVSLGYYVGEMRARQFYDEVLVLVALGGLLVMGADLLSGWVRARTRRG